MHCVSTLGAKKRKKPFNPLFALLSRKYLIRAYLIQEREARYPPAKRAECERDRSGTTRDSHEMAVRVMERIARREARKARRSGSPKTI
jgi:hypothetical protein